MKFIFIVVGGLFVVLPFAWLVWNSRAHTPSAPYTVVRHEGALEWRDYPSLTLAITPMNDERGSDAFGHLFGFISGKNATREKIPMTTPVLIDPAAGKRTMSFVMPEAITRKGVPEPSGSNVRVSKTEPGRYVVLRFKGSGNEKNRQIAAEKLNAWLRQHNINPESEPIFAYYDPPWTPIFLRRNEVMVRVASEAK